MNGSYLLDTNIVIAMLAEERAVIQGLEMAEEVFLSSIVLGELYFGARKSSRSEANVARLDRLASNSTVLSCDIETARYYGEVKDGLRRKGRPIPENDVWIAAVALQHGLTLVTRDGHMDEVEGLRTESWSGR